MAPRHKRTSDARIHAAKAQKFQDQSSIGDEKELHGAAEVSPFFTKISYDVRRLMYDFLDLPPLYSGHSHSGFILSCRQAFNETSEAAGRQLSTRLKSVSKEWQDDYGRELRLSKQIDPSSSFGKLEKLTIYFTPHEFHVLCGRSDPCLPSFRSLLSMWSNKVVLYFLGRASEFDDTLFLAGQLPHVTRFLRIVGEHIEQQNPRNTGAHTSIADVDRCNTKGIAIAWNFLHEDSDTRPLPKMLTGIEFKFSNPYLISRRRMAGLNTTPLRIDRHPKRYEFKARNDRIGETGLHCESRWNFECDEEMEKLTRLPIVCHRDLEIASMRRWMERDDYLRFQDSQNRETMDHPEVLVA